MKKVKALLFLPLFAVVFLFSSFAAPKHQAAIANYAWYTPAGQFVAWSTLANAEFVSVDDTNPVGGTMALLGYTGGDFGKPPSGTLVYQLYSHP